jgi:hypothetical protein
MYVIVHVPAETPVTIPVNIPTDAIEMSLQLHVPPIVALLHVMVSPAHTVDAPKISAGIGLTVTVACL